MQGLASPFTSCCDSDDDETLITHDPKLSCVRAIGFLDWSVKSGLDLKAFGTDPAEVEKGGAQPVRVEEGGKPQERPISVWQGSNRQCGRKLTKPEVGSMED